MCVCVCWGGGGGGGGETSVGNSYTAAQSVVECVFITAKLEMRLST